jgi:hypothetical protein
MRINQRLAATNADDTYCLDRWNILTQTSTVAVTQVTLAENNTPYMMRITQSQASAQRFGVEQIVEALNAYNLRGQSVTLSARVRMSASTTLRYAILEWTGTADSVTSDVVNDWTSGTYTAGNFFLGANLTVTATGSTALTANTLTSVSLSTTMGSSTNTLIVFFWTDSTQAQNVTLDVGNAQFEYGATASAFERRPVGAEFTLCARYFEKSYDGSAAPGSAVTSGLGLVNGLYVAAGAGSAITVFAAYSTSKRTATPTLTVYDNAGTSNKVSYYNGAWNNGGTIFNTRTNQWGMWVQANIANMITMNCDITSEAEL